MLRTRLRGLEIETLMRNPIRVLFFHAEVMGYTTATLTALATMGVDVHVVAWDSKKLTEYKIPTLEKVTFYRRSSFNSRGLRKLAEQINPEIVVVSGWQDPAYVRAAFALRRKGFKTVTGLDTQWEGGPRFLLAEILGKLGVFKSIYSYAWIPGLRQFETAKRLGYRDHEIISNLYSADIKLFTRAQNKSPGEPGYYRVFLFVGRLVKEKGLTDLLAAWNSLSSQRGGWVLKIIGDGELRDVIPSDPSIILNGFLQPDDLAREISESGCFVIPSRREPWGVVVHEFAAVGLPLILSSGVGSSDAFLIDGFNGYRVRPGKIEEIAGAMRKIIECDPKTLREFGERSALLSQRITPETSAASLFSLIRTEN